MIMFIFVILLTFGIAICDISQFVMDDTVESILYVENTEEHNDNEEPNNSESFSDSMNQLEHEYDTDIEDTDIEDTSTYDVSEHDSNDSDETKEEIDIDYSNEFADVYNNANEELDKDTLQALIGESASEISDNITSF